MSMTCPRDTSKVSPSFRRFVTLVQRHRDRRIEHLTQENIDDCKRVFNDEYRVHRNFSLAVYYTGLHIDDVMIIEGWRHYTTRVFLEGADYGEQEDLRINGLLLHASCNMSSKAPEVTRYLEKMGVSVPID
ncbi:hypothetical protein BGW38_004454, partial [Lunasporangiospora selenospora]